jgi:hypothetical protein
MTERGELLPDRSRISAAIALGQSWNTIQSATGCSRATIGKIAAHEAGRIVAAVPPHWRRRAVASLRRSGLIAHSAREPKSPAQPAGFFLRGLVPAAVPAETPALPERASEALPPDPKQ